MIPQTSQYPPSIGTHSCIVSSREKSLFSVLFQHLDNSTRLGSHLCWVNKGACCIVDGRWTQDQKAWGSIPTAGYVKKCQANFSFHTTSAYTAVMGTWWTKLVSEWLKLPAYLYDECAVFCQVEMRLLKWCVSCTRERKGQLNMV